MSRKKSVHTERQRETRETFRYYRKKGEDDDRSRSHLPINHVIDREGTRINIIKFQRLLSHSDLDDAE